MLYEGRRFTFSDEGQEIAKEVGLNEIAKQHRDENGSFIKYLEQYLGEDGQLYQWSELRKVACNLVDNNQREKIEIILARLSSEVPLPWGIEGNDTENLLGIPNIARRIEGIPLHDAAILSGGEGIQLLRDYPEIEERLKRQYTNSRLANAAFVGAYLLEEPPVPTLDKCLPDGVVREITFSPDFHGDFRIGVGESFRHGSLTPLGEKVPFAPAMEKKAFAAYHSVEPDILLAAMRYLEIIGLNAEEQAEIYTNILQKAETDLPAGNFGDFGDDKLRQYLDDIEDEKWWQQNLEFVKESKEFMHSIIVPGKDDWLFVISFEQERFVIKNISPSQSEELPLEKEDIEDFITLMISSPGGRTSAHTLVDMVIARLDQLKAHL